MSFLSKLAGLFDVAKERIKTTFFSAIDDVRNSVTLKTVRAR
ncbi:hypothetical protein [Jiella avicenniae]|nr:hypothetical protein [Jiella avicenniae]